MLLAPISDLCGKAFEANGLPATLGRVQMADRPDLADVQCNGALQAAKIAGKPPRAVAESVLATLKAAPEAKWFSDITLAGPGFINFKLAPGLLQEKLAAQNTHAKFGFELAKKERVVIDFCGTNIGKAMHVGHMRPTIVGDAVQRIFRYAGHDVFSDVHLGDWGLPMGIIINEVMLDQPELPYFKDGFAGPFPDTPPFSIADLATLYPRGSARTKDNEPERQKVRLITAQLQDGHPGHRALWKHIVAVSTADIRLKTDALDVTPDYWYGESDAHPFIAPMLDDLKARGIAVMDDGALVVHVAKPDDKYEVPPVLLVKRDGGVMYGTTDLATIVQRQKDFNPDQIVYVIDNRQKLHIEQVFRAARIAGYAPQAKLHFAGFGTMNDKDGKPFKTRAGDLPTLQEFMDNLVAKATDRLKEIELDKKLDPNLFSDTAKKVGFAAMKYGDLMNPPQSDYIFDIEKFVSFEGKTGPYIQYTVVRVNALLAKAAAQNFVAGAFQIDALQHDVALLLLQFPHVIDMALADYAPNILADYVFRLAQSVNRFYQNVPVLIEEDTGKRGAALALLGLSARILTSGLDLLGIKIPTQM